MSETPESSQVTKGASVEEIKPSRLPHWAKWIVLALGLMLEFGNAYCIDIPSATHDQLEVWFYGDPKNQRLEFEYFFNFMYSAANLPNILIPLCVGALSDNFGDVIVFPVIIALAFIGATGVAAGVQMYSQPLVLASRAVLGIGYSGIVVLNCVLVSKWFEETTTQVSHLGLAMSLIGVFYRIGTIVNNASSPQLARHISVPFAYWFGAILMACCVLCGIFLSMLNRFRTHELTKSANKSDIEVQSQASTHDNSRRSIWKSIVAYPVVFWVIVIQLVLFYGVTFGANNVLSAYLIGRICSGECCPANVTSCEARDYAQDQASLYMNIPQIISVVAGPLCGLAIDWFGRRDLALTVSTGLCAVCFLLFSLEHVDVLIPLCLEGLSIAIFVSTAWACIPLVVEKSAIGMAFALAESSQCISLTVFPIIVSAIRTRFGSYISPQLFFFGVSCIMLGTSIGLNILDRQNDGILGKRPNQIKQQRSSTVHL